MTNITLESPQKLKPLFQPCRYKVIYGGRGGSKSWFCARTLLILGLEKPLRILCAREIQKSIQDSVHQLLRDQIVALGLQGFYQVLQNEIRGLNGTLFTFAGLKHNVDSLKSKEGIDVVWVEEAHNVSKDSWDKLIPTIRKPGSEIWITFNPELEDDETYQRFVVNPPKNSIVIKVNYNDNPWFPEVLRLEMEELQAKDHKAYLNVWEGYCKSAVEGAIFAEMLAKAQDEGRIGSFPYVATAPVYAHFDLGRNDKTAIWFVQTIGMKYYMIDYYENSGQHFSHYVKYLKEKPYQYGTIYLPHDAENEVLAAEKSIAVQARQAFSSVVIVPRIPKKALAIDAARGIFHLCHFDNQRCGDGVTALRRYAYKKDPQTGKTSPEPEHDTPWSHGADAFMSIGQARMMTEAPKLKRRAMEHQNLPRWAHKAGIR